MLKDQKLNLKVKVTKTHKETIYRFLTTSIALINKTLVGAVKIIKAW